MGPCCRLDDTDGPSVLLRPYCRPPGAAPLALPQRPPVTGRRTGQIAAGLARPLREVCLPAARPRRRRARLAAMCQVVNAASITRRRAEQAGRLGDLAKTNPPGGLPYRSAAGAGRDALSASPRNAAQ